MGYEVERERESNICCFFLPSKLLQSKSQIYRCFKWTIPDFFRLFNTVDSKYVFFNNLPMT